MESSRGIFPSQGSKLMSLMSPTSACEFFASSTTREANLFQYLCPILLGMYLGVKFLPHMVTLLEEGMAIHSSILAWRIPQRSLARCSPLGSHRVGHN